MILNMRILKDMETIVNMFHAFKEKGHFEDFLCVHNCSTMAGIHSFCCCCCVICIRYIYWTDN
jgi:hypothetical protein